MLLTRRVGCRLIISISLEIHDGIQIPPVYGHHLEFMVVKCVYYMITVYCISNAKHVGLGLIPIPTVECVFNNSDAVVEAGAFSRCWRLNEAS